jgi:uncharacterized protein (DUF58 family)
MSDLPFLIIFLLALGILLQVDFLFYIVYVCLGIYGWSQWITPRALRQIEARRSFRQRAFLGEKIPITLEIRNKSRLPVPWVQFVESVPVALIAGAATRRVTSLSGHESKRYTYHVQAQRRGYYRIGPLLLTLGDLFGFTENRRRITTDHITVYPKIVPLTRLGLPSRLPFGTIASRQRLFEDPARPTGVRDYRSGDSLRHINWKVSAHTENLLVKTFQPAISLETAILLNLNRTEFMEEGRYEAPEWAIVVAASLAAHLANQRQPVGLLTNGADPLRQKDGGDLAFDELSGRLLLQAAGSGQSGQPGPAAPLVPPPIPPRPGRPHLMKVLEQLARIEPADTLPFVSWAPQACLNLSWGVTILTITPNGDPGVCHRLHSLVRAGYNPVLIAVQASPDFGQVRERARRLGFAAYQVSRPQELDTWRRPAFGVRV